MEMTRTLSEIRKMPIQRKLIKFRSDTKDGKLHARAWQTANDQRPVPNDQ